MPSDTWSCLCEYIDQPKCSCWNYSYLSLFYIKHRRTAILGPWHLYESMKIAKNILYTMDYAAPPSRDTWKKERMWRRKTGTWVRYAPGWEHNGQSSSEHYEFFWAKVKMDWNEKYILHAVTAYGIPTYTRMRWSTVKNSISPSEMLRIRRGKEKL